MKEPEWDAPKCAECERLRAVMDDINDIVTEEWDSHLEEVRAIVRRLDAYTRQKLSTLDKAQAPQTPEDSRVRCLYCDKPINRCVCLPQESQAGEKQSDE